MSIVFFWLGSMPFSKASEDERLSGAAQLYESFRSFKSGKNEASLTYKKLTDDLGPPTLIRKRGGLFVDYYWFFGNSAGSFCAIFEGTVVISVSFDNQNMECEFKSSGYNMLLSEIFSRGFRSDRKIVPIDPRVREAWLKFNTEEKRRSPRRVTLPPN